MTIEKFRNNGKHMGEKQSAGVQKILQRSKKWRDETKDPENSELKKELDDYYKNRDNLQCPNGLSELERHKWYLNEKEKLQSQLSKQVCAIVLARQRKWEMK